MNPDVSAAILRAFSVIRDSLNDAQLVRLIQLGQLDRLVSDVLSQAMMDTAMQPVRDVMRRGIAKAVPYFARDIPKPPRLSNVSVAFNVLNPRVIDAVRALETKVITGLEQTARDVVVAYVENGLRNGDGPRVIARSLRSVIGLGPTQLQEVENYRQKLLAGQSVAGYTLRDKRLSTKTPEQIERAVTAYTKRRIAQNAETVARTAALDAQKMAQRMSWMDAAEKGIVDMSKLRKRWMGVLDERERPLHLQAQGETAGFDEPFPTTHEVVPGESTYNCRCIAQYFVA